MKTYFLILGMFGFLISGWANAACVQVLNHTNQQIVVKLKNIGLSHQIIVNPGESGILASNRKEGVTDYGEHGDHIKPYVDISTGAMRRYQGFGERTIFQDYTLPDQGCVILKIIDLKDQHGNLIIVRDFEADTDIPTSAYHWADKHQ